MKKNNINKIILFLMLLILFLFTGCALSPTNWNLEWTSQTWIPVIIAIIIAIIMFIISSKKKGINGRIRGYNKAPKIFNNIRSPMRSKINIIKMFKKRRR